MRTSCFRAPIWRHDISGLGIELDTPLYVMHNWWLRQPKGLALARFYVELTDLAGKYNFGSLTYAINPTEAVTLKDSFIP